MNYPLAFLAFVIVLLFVWMISAVMNAGRRAAEIRRQRREAEQEMAAWQRSQKRS